MSAATVPRVRVISSGNYPPILLIDGAVAIRRSCLSLCPWTNFKKIEIPFPVFVHLVH
jgi:hypothetical protein